MAFGDATSHADVELGVNLGRFRADMGEAGQVYNTTTGRMSKDSLRAAISHEKLLRAISRSGPESLAAKSATLAYRREMEALNQTSNRTTTSLAREERQLGRLARGSLSGAGALGKLRGAAVFASSSFLGGFGLTYALRSAVNAASTLQEETEKTGVVFGKNAADVQEWARTLALSFGVSEDAALKAAGTFGNMLRPLHFGEQDAAKRSERLVELAADMASFNNVKPDVVLQALSSGLAGQVRPLRQYGVFLSQTRIEQEAYAAGIAKTGTKLTQQQKVQAAYNIILKDTKLQQGDVARNTGSLSVAQSKFTAELQDTEAIVARDLLPELTGLFNQGGRYLDQLNQSGQLQRDVNHALEEGGQAARGIGDALHFTADLVRPLNTLLGGTRATVRDLAIALLLLRARALLAGSGLLTAGGQAVTAEAEFAAAGTAAKTAAADMTVAGGSAGRLGGRLSVLTAAPWVITVLVAYQDIKDPHSIERRAKGLFDLVKKGGLIEQGLESLPTVGPVIAAIHNATQGGSKKPGPGQSPIGENALPGGPGSSGDGGRRGRAAAPPPRRPLGLIARYGRADTALSKATAQGDTAAERQALEEERRITRLEISSTKKAFKDKKALYDQLAGINGQLDALDQAAAAKRAAAERKRQEAERKREAAERKLTEQRKAAARRRREAQAKQRAAQIDRLTNAPLDLRIEEQTAIAHGASEAKLLAIYKQELKAIEQQIPIIRRLHLGKQAIYEARRNEAEIQKKIAGLNKKKTDAGTTDLLGQAADLERIYGSNVGRRNDPLSPQDALGLLGELVRLTRENTRHAATTAKSTQRIGSKGGIDQITMARALAHQGL